MIVMKNLRISRSILLFGFVFGFGVLSLSAMELQPSPEKIVDLRKGPRSKSLRDGSYQIILNNRIVTVNVENGFARLPKSMGVCAKKAISDRALLNKILNAQQKSVISHEPVISKENDSLYNYFNNVYFRDLIPGCYYTNPILFQHVNDHLDRYSDVLSKIDRISFNPKIKRFAVREQGDCKRCGLFATCNAIHFLRAKNEDEACTAFLKDSLLDDKHEDHSFFKIIESVCLSFLMGCDFNGGNSEEKVKELLKRLKEENVITEDELKNIVIISEKDTARTKKLISDLMYLRGDNESERLRDLIEQKRDLLIDGQVQVFLVSSQYHWVPFRVEYVPGSNDSVHVWTADSGGFHSDPTKVDSIERIVQIMGMEIVKSN